jgi:hypothetical protein
LPIGAQEPLDPADWAVQSATENRQSAIGNRRALLGGLAVTRVRLADAGALRAALSKKARGVFLEINGRAEYAVLRLDDDVLDFLLEHSPRLIAECARAREQARQGKTKTLAEVKKEFDLE